MLIVKGFSLCIVLVSLKGKKERMGFYKHAEILSDI
jgi:hypothetical protein